jgi:hypothetical protein
MLAAPAGHGAHISRDLVILFLVTRLIKCMFPYIYFCVFRYTGTPAFLLLFVSNKTGHTDSDKWMVPNLNMSPPDDQDEPEALAEPAAVKFIYYIFGYSN